jgi:hypothetical protein
VPQCCSVQHRSHMTCPRLERGTPRREEDDLPPELGNGVVIFIYGWLNKRISSAVPVASDTTVISGTREIVNRSESGLTEYPALASHSTEWGYLTRRVRVIGLTFQVSTGNVPNTAKEHCYHMVTLDETLKLYEMLQAIKSKDEM